MTAVAACSSGDSPRGELCIDADNDGYPAADAQCTAEPFDCADDDASIFPGATEACDGVDNNCDERVDEGCSCDSGEVQACGSDVGTCQQGEQVCENGAFGDCRGATLPAEEVCDGLDNDCDGEVDEELTAVSCELVTGVCLGAKKSCGGSDGWLDCAVNGSYGEHFVADEDPSVDPSLCDGLDNDCDGHQDEGCSCTDGRIQPCGTDEGECSAGSQTCVNGIWGPCEDEVPPTSELCDGLDNDCDAEVDEGVRRPDCALSEGVCAGAKKQCVDGAFAACGTQDYGDEYQLEETSCDAKDNDCDGEVDEGCTCVDGRTQRCGSDVGVCEAGFQTCVDGEWGPCEDLIVGGPEVCNGLDDDCDGMIDEAEDLSPDDCELFLGVCAGAKQSCWGQYGWQACGPAQYGELYEEEETSCDGHDNDCDGETDETCECIHGGLQICGSNVGMCTTGLQECVSGVWGECEGEDQPRPEACNGDDDDCDGSVDEDLTELCELQLGVCEGAITACSEGDFPTCTIEEYGPRYEQIEISCDGRDNDCDGLVDEDCPTPPILINEVLYDELSSDTGRTMFIELSGPSRYPLGGLTLVAVNGHDGAVYAELPLPNEPVPFNGAFLIVNQSANTTLLDISDFAASLELQGGPDSLQLVWNAGTGAEQVIDALGYGAFGSSDVFAGEGSPAADTAPGESLTRDASSTDTDDNSVDFMVSSASEASVPTPGGAPLPKMHINLSWDTAESDLDLHLLSGGATFMSFGDCYYANRTPDWGVSGDAIDDPRLDRDDHDGYGPEFMDVLVPSDDTYLIEVHAYYSALPSIATVEILVDNGGEVGLTEVVLSHELETNDYWAVATVSVVDGALEVTRLDQLATEPFNND